MKKKEIKKKICVLLENMVRESIGRSIPFNYHEPKIPECLKKKN